MKENFRLMQEKVQAQVQLTVLLILWVEIVDGVGHDVLGIHRFLYTTKVFGFSINLHSPTHRLFTFKLLEIDCIVTDRPWMSVTQLCA